MIAMAILLCELYMPYVTNLPRDVSINAFHFNVEGDADNTSNHESIAELLTELYMADVDGGDGDGLNICGMLSSCIKKGPDDWYVKFYDAEVGPSVDPGTHKVLLNQIYITPTELPYSETDYPNEVSICASLTCTPATFIDPRRRRGRFYIGPLNSSVGGNMTVGGQDAPAVASTHRAAIASSCERLATQTLDDFVHWSVWSPTNEQAYEVTGGFVDNEFDTQRRRQYRATSRSVWGAAFP